MIKIEQGDCLTLLGAIGDKSVDMILVDPPYGTTPLKWDTVIDFNELWNQYKRVIKDNGAICVFGQEPFSSMLRVSNMDMYKYDWYWEKEALTNVFQVKRRPGKVVETISVFYFSQPTYNPQKYEHLGKPVTNKIGENAKFSAVQAGLSPKSKPLEYIDDMSRYPKQVLRINRENRHSNVHPTQKPVALLEYLIKTYTNENEVVLDSCMGSGSTGVACVKTNRSFIGFEMSNEYFKIAKDRIEEEKNKVKLW